MGKIKEYIEGKLISQKEKHDQISEEIHSLELEIESSKAAVEKIVNRNDETGIVFSTAGSIKGFDGKEIDKLNKQIEEMNKKKEVLIAEQEELQNDINNLSELQNEYYTSEKYNTLNKYSNADVIAFVESDRQRIARDIHDSVVQSLSALMYKMEFIKKVSESDIQRARIELEAGNSLVKECIDELRNVIYDLRPMSLDDLGFENALFNLMSKIKDSTDMVVEYKCIGDFDNIENIVLITTIRIIQELCSNSIKYSEGSNIGVFVSANENCIELIQKDDGKGYDTKIRKKPKSNNTGYGLPILMERVKLLDGTVNVSHGDNNKGMKYKIVIPYNNIVDEE